MQILSSSIYNDNCTVTVINRWSFVHTNVKWCFIFSNWARSTEKPPRLCQSKRILLHIYANYSFCLYQRILQISFCFIDKRSTLAEGCQDSSTSKHIRMHTFIMQHRLNCKGSIRWYIVIDCVITVIDCESSY